MAASPIAWAQNAAPAGKTIYTCTDARGKRLTSDRLIPECSDREQRELNSDGSLKRIIPPTLTADERGEAEAREREAAAARVARQDATRRDRNLMARFSNEAAHRKAREAALDDVRNSVRTSEARVKLLMAERKPLLDEAEFYVGKDLPAKLKDQLDANDAALAAQRSLIQNQETEVVRINGLYDLELARLKKLWAGGPAGSLGPAGSASGPPPAAQGYAPKAAAR
ncbi:MAG TPA: hypothetical protein VF308_13725 [Caldimonas sp.]